MSDPWPWEVGDHEQRWNAYFTAPGSGVLRNKVGATESDHLLNAENDLLEFRLAQLRDNPGLVNRTYDLDHLQRIHGQLFQDVYEWAGDLRTVGLAKGDGESFMPPAQIEMPMNHAANRIAESDLLQTTAREALPGEVAYLYDYINFAHPFREGNGRAQREFFAQLLAESRHGLDWSLIEMTDLHEACHLARNEDDISPLNDIFARILTDEPSYSPS